jgi:hypothetical protein
MHPLSLAVLYADFVHLAFYSVIVMGTLFFVVALIEMLLALKRRRN